MSKMHCRIMDNLLLLLAVTMSSADIWFSLLFNQWCNFAGAIDKVESLQCLHSIVWIGQI